MKRRLLVLGVVFSSALAVTAASGRGPGAYVSTSPTLTAMQASDVKGPQRLSVGIVARPFDDDNRGGWLDWLAERYSDFYWVGCCSGSKGILVDDSVFD